MLAPDPIPLFLFAKTRDKFGEPLRTALAGDGLDEAIAALRAFALVDHDERDTTVTTDAIRLHRLVREVAALRANESGTGCAGAHRGAGGRLSRRCLRQPG